MDQDLEMRLRILRHRQICFSAQMAEWHRKQREQDRVRAEQMERLKEDADRLLAKVEKLCRPPSPPDAEPG